MAINRVLFATQTARLYLYPTAAGGASSANAQAGGWNAYLPIQSASADETIPQDDVLVMGKIDGVARLQKDVSTSKSSLKAYIATTGKYNTTVTANQIWPQGGASLTSGTGMHQGAVWSFHELLNDLEVAATEGVVCYLQVDSLNVANAANGGDDGFKMYGICSSIGIDASKGGFPTLDLSFEGVGRLTDMSMGSQHSLAHVNGGVQTIKELTPLISSHVSLGTEATHGADVVDTINSVKFSFDMPTETLSRMGGIIMGTYNNVYQDNRIFSKPPYKASMTVDGQSLSAVERQWRSGDSNGALGNTTANGIAFRLKYPGWNGVTVAIDRAGSTISARSFSQNVGDVGATFSVSAEGSGASYVVAT